MKMYFVTNAVIMAMVCASSLGMASNSTNTVFQKTFENGVRIEVIEEITNSISRPIEITPYGTQRRYSDRNHFYRFIVKTNQTDLGRQIWERGDSSFEDDVYFPYLVLDIHLDTTNLVVVHRWRGGVDFCDIIDLASKKGLDRKAAQLLDGPNPLNKPSPQSLTSPHLLPGRTKVGQTPAGVYQVMSVLEPGTNAVVLRFIGDRWQLLGTNEPP